MMNELKWDAVALGEIMLRLSPVGSGRLASADLLQNHAGGSEFNVLAGLASLGGKTAMLTKLPEHAMASFIRMKMRALGVSDAYVIADREEGARVGIYYFEGGIAPRKPGVVYDRRHASITRFEADDVSQALPGHTRIFHTSGITLALSPQVCAQAVKTLRRFRENGALISFDVNFRANLWSEADARAAIEQVLPDIDILFISEESCRKMFARQGELRDILRDFARIYDLKIVATTQRQVNSPSSHDFTSLLYDKKTDDFYTEPPYRNIQVVDRIGSGDAYVAGVLYTVLAGLDRQQAVSYGNAMAALKSTVAGDLPCTDLDEVQRMIADHQQGGGRSEMNR